MTTPKLRWSHPDFWYCDQPDCEQETITNNQCRELCNELYRDKPASEGYYQCLCDCNTPLNRCFDPRHILMRRPRPLHAKPDGRLESSECTDCRYYLYLRLEGGICQTATPNFRPQGIRTFGVDGEENDDGRYFIIPVNQDWGAGGTGYRTFPDVWRAEDGEDDAYDGKIAVVRIGVYDSVEIARYVIVEFASILEEFRAAYATQSDFYGDGGDCVFTADNTTQPITELYGYVSHHRTVCVGTPEGIPSKGIVVRVGSVGVDGSSSDERSFKFVLEIDGESEWVDVNPTTGESTTVKYGEWYGEGGTTVGVPACSRLCIRCFVVGDLSGLCSMNTHFEILTEYGYDESRMQAAEAALDDIPEDSCGVYEYKQLKELEEEMEE